MYQHPPIATQPAMSVHHTTATASHSAFPNCCQASPLGSQYLTSPTSSPHGRTGDQRRPVRHGRGSLRRNSQEVRGTRVVGRSPAPARQGLSSSGLSGTGAVRSRRSRDTRGTRDRAHPGTVLAGLGVGVTPRSVSELREHPGARNRSEALAVRGSSSTSGCWSNWHPTAPASTSI